MKPLLVCAAVVVLSASTEILGQLIDKNKAPNTSNDGISRPLIGLPYPSEIGEGRTGEDWNASQNVIAFDPFRAIRRGRQLFQRKFTRLEGQGAVMGDGVGNIDVDLAIGAGLVDSCAGCHGRPRGSAGFGGDVVTRPDSRDAPHLFGLGLKEMLADEITTHLRAIRAAAVRQASRTGLPVARPLISKGISYGTIRALPDGSVDTLDVEGVDADLRVRPFFYHGGTISLREFIVGALKAEMGLAMANDPDLIGAQSGPVTTAAGMVLNGLTDTIEQPPTDEGDIGSVEQRTALVDFLEFYLLNYFKAGTGEQTPSVKQGREVFEKAGCVTCHMPKLRIQRDRRVADVETMFDPDNGNFNRLFATARLLLANPSSVGQARVAKIPAFQPFVVENILHRLQASRPRAEFPRAQLRWHDAHAVPHDSVVGCRKHAAVRPRRTQHQSDGGHPPPWWGGAGGTRRVYGALSPESRRRDRVPELAHHFPAGRHRVESRPGRSLDFGVPSIPARKHSVDGPVQRFGSHRIV